jgi:hypothetical protein
MSDREGAVGSASWIRGRNAVILIGMRLAAGMLIAVSACYAPTPLAGAPCDLALDNCPAGQHCEMTGTGAYCVALGSRVDSGMDGARPDTAPGCFGAGIVHDVCLMPAPTIDVMIAGDRTINTATVGSGNCDSIMAQSGGPSLCMITGRTITIASASRLIGVGPNPLVLVASDTITVTGTIDVASRLSSLNPGAGADTTCGSPAGNSASEFEGAGGGGAGGSFGTRGGNGGTGRSPNQATPGAQSSAAQSPTALRGGCSGGQGGAASGGGGNGVGGFGGGSVYVIAGSMIAISGAINASGSGGGPGTDGLNASGGAGGGGSGGMIGLDAPTITSTGEIFANGGSGGGGGGDMPDRHGQPGSTPTAASIAAPGGAGGNGGGGKGGNGSVLTTAPLSGNNGTNPYCSGGGGGGGAGVIRVFGVSASALGGVVSPPAT